MGAGSSIDTTVTSTVTLGSAAYPSPLTVARAGDIDPSAFGATGLYVPTGLTGGSILDDGHIFGANGPGLEFFQVKGGVGVDIEGTANLVSYGFIAGGAGGTSFNTALPGSGGVGLIVRTGSSVSSHGGIYGGAGGYGHTLAGAGATAVEDIGAAKFTNFGNITGGYGGESGAPGAHGGTGLYLYTATTASNAGTIAGGHGGYGTGRYIGSYDAFGGDGVVLETGAKLTNTGSITGGLPGTVKNGITGSEGGNAAVLANATLTNSGVITGAGGGFSANGGFGISAIGAGNNITNTGTIIGGTGGEAIFDNFDGLGGEGVYLNGTLTNAGTIIGALGGDFGLSRSDAVEFGPNAPATLILKPGAVFVGDVMADSPNKAVLELTGKSSLVGVGYDFVGFNNISFASGAGWTIAGDAAALSGGQKITGFTAADKIKLVDAAAASGTVKVKADGKVTVTAGGDTYVLDIVGAVKGSKDFKFSNYTLSEKSSAAAKMKFIGPATAEIVTTAAAPVLHTAAVPVAHLTFSPATPAGWAPFEARPLDYGGLMTAVRLAGGGF